MENVFVDCHCHISAHEFEEDLDDVIKRSRAAGVQTLVAVTEEANEFDTVLQLQDRYPGLVAPCLGLHPLQRPLQAGGGCGAAQRSVTLQDLEPVLPRFHVHAHRLVGVGEIGLDFTPWCAPTSLDRHNQLTVFIQQLCIARELSLPVNVHSRSAAKVTIATMIEQGISRALLHNFAGKPSVALEGVKAGYYFSFPPAVCLNQQRDRLIRQIPLEHICLETDSPALGPVKQARNEPSNIAVSCQYIAKVKGLPPQTVQHITTENAYRLFHRAE